MDLFKKIPFSFEDESYEARIYYDDSLISVLVFRNNYPANGFRHQLKLTQKQSADEFLNHEVINELVDMAREDITEKRWARLRNKPATIE